MSNDDTPKPDPRPALGRTPFKDGVDYPPLPPERPRRNGFLTALMILFGAIFLLPGLCAAVFMTLSLQQGGNSLFAEWGGLWVACLMISALGVFMIVKAFR